MEIAQYLPRREKNTRECSARILADSRCRNVCKFPRIDTDTPTDLPIYLRAVSYPYPPGTPTIVRYCRGYR